ncbi:hypothetical protein H4R20_001475 [Coemansia guatemalensis]|uniref:RlpA-like protein double-psi beta-barrel domain-containing protein n=1 Tax=Coemansia guatemalensis TaxID=2761395 RepID=A0A9W8I5S2_9FUNG|nr:hypothetical protein H4R20_001475 [Coemansia guatemalensis]
MKFQLTIPLLAVAFGGALGSPAVPTQTVVGGSGAAMLSQKAAMETLVKAADALASSASIEQNAAVQSLNSVAGITSGGVPQTLVPNDGENDNSDQNTDNLVIVTEIVTVTASDQQNGAKEQLVESTIESSIQAEDASAASGALPHDAQGSSADATQETAAAGGAEASPTAAEAPSAVDSQSIADISSSIAVATSATSATPAETASAAETSPAAETTSAAETSPAAESSQPEESPSSSEGGGDGGSSGGTYSGDGTYYTPGLGACGKTNSDSDLIAAINAPQYDATGSSNSAAICGKCAQVKGPKGEVKVTITDRCPVCKSGDLDLSPAAFDQIGDQSEGRISISWSFVDC